MTDRIEKIVNKWGFKRKDYGHYPRFERFWKDFLFSITLRDKGIEIRCRTQTKDNMICSKLHCLSMLYATSLTDKILELALQYPIKEFIDEFMSYDLFHEKDWKDGKE